MSDMKDDGGPAFPETFQSRDGNVYTTEFRTGLRLRDYFATHAPNPTDEEIQRVETRERVANPHNEPYHDKVRRRGRLEIVCALRYEYADAMIKERSKP